MPFAEKKFGVISIEKEENIHTYIQKDVIKTTAVFLVWQIAYVIVIAGTSRIPR